MHKKHIYSLWMVFGIVLLPWMSNAQTLYWIGGTGDWQDPNNWAETSGGFPSGINPGIDRDVVFDQFSFTAPGQVVSNAPGFDMNCRSIDFRNVTNMPIFRTTDTLRLDGSMWLSADMTWEHTGTVLFRSTSPNQEIDIFPQTFKGDVYIGIAGTGSDAEYDVRSPMVLEGGDLYLDNGGLRTNDFLLEASSIIIPDNDEQLLLDLGASTVNLIAALGDTSKLFAANDNLTLNAVNSTINLIGDNP